MALSRYGMAQLTELAEMRLVAGLLECLQLEYRRLACQQ
jgi:hypothetical protein